MNRKMLVLILLLGVVTCIYNLGRSEPLVLLSSLSGAMQGGPLAILVSNPRLSFRRNVWVSLLVVTLLLVGEFIVSSLLFSPTYD
jgi:hypothetical protein